MKQDISSQKVELNQPEAKSLKDLATNVLMRNRQRNTAETTIKKHETKPAQNVSSSCPVFDPDAFAERAAVIEHDGGTPREWAEGLARLDPNHPPAGVDPSRWLCFVDDCGRFLDGSGAAQAAKLGWGPLELFGCDKLRPLARVDHAGLLWLLEGRKLVSLVDTEAVIEDKNGNRLIYRHCPINEPKRVVLAWELSDSTRTT